MSLRVSIAAAALVVLSTAASAADLPVKAAPISPPPAISWTGFYIGAQVGGLWSHETRDTLSPLAEVFSQDGSGWLGGGQLGYNYQFASNFLAGIEGTFSGVSLSKESASAVFPPSHYITDVDWLATVTGRLGYVAGPWLIYARGGYAATKVTFIGTTPGDYVSVDGTRSGWTLGGGVEYMVMRNISVALEYDHYDFGTKHYDSQTVGGLPLHSDVSFTLDSVMLRANYHFGG